MQAGKLSQSISGAALDLAPLTTLSPFRSDPAGSATFIVLYALTVALLFDPPLPTKCISWSVPAKVALVTCAVLFGATQSVMQNATDSRQPWMELV
jgi:hypothetical protein